MSEHPAGADPEETGESSPIALCGVSKWYGGVLGLNDVTLTVGRGITALLGPNGAGKSTLLRLVTSQLRPTLGEVRVLGKRVWGSPGVRRRLGYAPEADAFPRGLRVEEFVRWMGRLAGLSRRAARRRTHGVLERTGMAAEARKRLQACSKGMRQRVKLAQALVHDPDVIVLDEPLTGIDPPGRRDLLRLFAELRQEGKTILFSSHILHEVEELADEIALIAQGRLLAAGPLGRVRDLLDEHPLTVRITCRDRRRLAAALLARPAVVGVAVDGAAPGGEAASAVGAPDRGDLIVKVARPEAFYRDLPPLLRELGADVERLETLDDSVEAVFGYLVGGVGASGERGEA